MAAQVREWIRDAANRLSAAGFESANIEAQLLAAHVLLVDRAWLIAHAEDPFPELAGEAVLAARLGHTPLAYILGWREFYGRRFSVRSGVLIPRHETEILVEMAMSLSLPRSAMVLDLGTGSGIIAITLKLERPSWKVLASDISGKALEIARQNADDLGAELRFVESDGFDRLNSEQFDAIVTNPPYIGLDETLPDEVKLFEPEFALFSGPTGFEFYERIANEAPAYLRASGFLLMEVGYQQASKVADLFTTRGWAVAEIVHDLAGIARVVVCRKPPTSNSVANSDSIDGEARER